MTRAPLICIVDATSSGALYPAAIRARGFESLHVQTLDPYPPLYQPSFVRGDHAANIVFAGDLQECARRVAAHRPVCVIPGTETGVFLADSLSELLGLPTNGTKLSPARRDKLVMQQMIAKAGVRSIPSHAAADWASIEAWIDRLGQLPIVLKPSASAGTDRVFVCKTLAQAEGAFRSIVGAANIVGHRNDTVIAQQYMQGVEYMMNTVSCAGHHLMTDSWRMNKVVGQHPVYEYGQLQDPTSALHQQLFDYTCSVLDALGIRFGAVHTELMLTDEGPVLIEAGCRVDGQKSPVLAKAALGYSQIEVTLDAHLHPEAFFARLATPAQALPRQASRVELICPRSGRVTGLPRLDEVRALRSFFQIALSIHVGDQAARTIDMMTCPGFIDLVHEDPRVIEQDYLRIRAWEADNFYELAD